MKRTAEITLEIVETIIVRKAGQSVNAFCPHCAATVEMASPQTVAEASHFSEREIFRLIEAGEIHFIEIGRVLICLNSMPRLENE